jgi:ABC-type nitrate/sulfonate/bicarbonate transport system permease component
MLPIPHEFAIAGVYLPPMLIAAILGVALATLSGRLLNRNRWSQHFFYPPLVMLAMIAIYTVLIGTFIIGS